MSRTGDGHSRSFCCQTSALAASVGFLPRRAGTTGGQLTVRLHQLDVSSKLDAVLGGRYETVQRLQLHSRSHCSAAHRPIARRRPFRGRGCTEDGCTGVGRVHRHHGSSQQQALDTTGPSMSATSPKRVFGWGRIEKVLAAGSRWQYAGVGVSGWRQALAEIRRR